MNKTVINYSVVIDWEKGETTVKEKGVKCPLSGVQSVEKTSVYLCMLDLAWYVLEKAAFIKKQAPVTEADILHASQDMELNWVLPFH